MKIVMILLSLLATAAWAQTNPIHLQATPVVVDPSAHTLTFALLNQSEKVVVAYILEYKHFDVSGKLIADYRVGVDNLYFNSSGDPDPQHEVQLIPPGKTHPITQLQLAGSAAANAATTTVSVLAVVYADRTWEGSAHAVFPIFDTRARTAQRLKEAAALFETSPATAEAARVTVQKLRELETPSIQAVVADKFGLPMGILVDAKQPLPPTITAPTAKQCADAAASLLDRAAFFTEQSQEVQQ
jgi:hypothetical protein